MDPVGALDLARAATVLLVALTAALAFAALLAARQWRIEEEARASFSSLDEERGARGILGRLREALRASLEGSGVPFSEHEMLSVWTACVALPPLAVLALGAGALAAVAVAAVGAAAPALWLRHAKRRNRMRFADDLGHALPLVATNLRGGLSIKQALVPVATNLNQPIKGEFEILSRNLERGMSVEEALAVMAERNDNKDLVLLASAVATQTETGGNLADIVDTVAGTIRQRTELRRSISSKTAQQRGTAVFLLLFPVVILVAVCALSTTYLEFYTQPLGWVVLIVCALLEGCGYYLVNRMTDIKID